MVSDPGGAVNLKPQEAGPGQLRYMSRWGPGVALSALSHVGRLIAGILILNTRTVGVDQMASAGLSGSRLGCDPDKSNSSISSLCSTGTAFWPRTKV